VFSSSRVFRTGKGVDTSSITDPFKGSVNGFGRYTEFWRELGYRPSQRWLPTGLAWRSFHLSTKAGPNGHALCTALNDLYSLPTSLVLNIMTLGGDDLDKRKITLWSNPSFFSSKPGKFRKLSSFPDKEDKVRVIAI
jgi:hypothetical protein